MNLRGGVDGLFETFNDKAGRFMIDDFVHRAASKRHDRGAARERLDHHEAERFRPVDRKKKGLRMAEKLVLAVLSDLSDEFKERIVEQRLNLPGKIRRVGRIDFRRDSQRVPAGFGDPDN